jgi:Mrp family chromosome partitioning ATPase
VLRTSVLFSTGAIPPKTILITSGEPGEGKTTTVINTAISLSQLGASVLIIDADLRKPMTHRGFGLSSERGLSTYLSSEVEIDGLIQRVRLRNVGASGPHGEPLS